MAYTPLPRPPCLLAADSATVALEGAAGALVGKLTDPFAVSPIERWGADWLNRMLPPAAKTAVIRKIARGTGRSSETVASADSHLIARWMVSLVPDQQWPGVILGAPSGAAAHLSSLLGFPLLSQHVLCGVQGHYALDDSADYLKALAPVVRAVLDRNPDFEALVHHDPVHDRFLVGDLGFIRLKYRRVPLAFREFLQRNLAPGAPVVILDCGFPWLQYACPEVHARCQLQIGGLGALEPERFTASPWGLKDREPDWQPESEWGTLPSFRDDAEAVARDLGLEPIVVAIEHPDELTTAVLRGFEALWPDAQRVYLDCFTNSCPAFNRYARALPLWLPFLGQDSYALAGRLLPSLARDLKVLLSLHPSFADPEDLTTIAQWEQLLTGRDVTWLGVDRQRYPTDLGAYGRYKGSLEEYLREQGMTRFIDERLGVERFLEIVDAS
ncbi:MAG: hypothetical protein ABI743_10360 [bacterium]